ncbi:MAG: hypothetical protein ACJ8R9_05635 [Steroidobacteraceae bacterium]
MVTAFALSVDQEIATEAVSAQAAKTDVRRTARDSKLTRANPRMGHCGGDSLTTVMQQGGQRPGILGAVTSWAG